MKIIAFLLSLCLLKSSPEKLTVIDMNLVKPPGYATEFAVDSYFKRRFPIHTSDLKDVIEATEKAAKLIDKKKDFISDTLLLSTQTTLVISASADKNKIITVRLITTLEGGSLSFNFDLVRNEDNQRKAQRRLLDFATYLQK